MLDKVKEIQKEVEVFNGKSLEELEAFRILLLGKKGKVTLLFKVAVVQGHSTSTYHTSEPADYGCTANCKFAITVRLLISRVSFTVIKNAYGRKFPGLVLST